MAWPSMKFKKFLLVGLLLLVWLGVHVPSFLYGSRNVPMTSSYVSDEIPGVLGSLHMSAAQSIFGLRDQPTVYYGPVYSAFTLPAVLVDYGARFFKGQVESPDDYRLAVLFNWGPLLFNARVTSTLIGFVGLWFVWLLFGTTIINPDKRRSLQILGVTLLATNFFYFVYSGWARHWIYDTVLCLAQIYFALRLLEKPARRHWVGLLVSGVLGFGVSFFPIIFQAALIPAIVGWIRRRDVATLKSLAWYTLALAACCGFIVFWNPMPFSWIWVGTQGTEYLIGTSHWASVWYFLSVITLDHPGLTTVFVISLAVLALKRELVRPTVLSVLLPTVTYFVFFATSWHPEPRYMMPVIVSMMVFSLMALARIWPNSRLSGWPLVLAVILAIEIIFQVVVLTQWSALIRRGPAEERVIVALNTVDESQRVLIDGSDMLAALHTSASLKAYVQNCRNGVSSATLRTLAEAVADGPDLLRADYYCDGRNGSTLRPQDYDVRVWRDFGYPATVNFFEEDLCRFWRYDDFGRKFLMSERGHEAVVFQ